MKKSERGDIDLFDIIIILILVGGLFGIGPCAEACHGHKHHHHDNIFHEHAEQHK